MNEPTDKQLEVLGIIDARIEVHGFSPSFREISEDLGSQHPNGAMSHLEALRKKGCVTWRPLDARTIRITTLGYSHLYEDV